MLQAEQPCPARSPLGRGASLGAEPSLLEDGEEGLWKWAVFCRKQQWGCWKGCAPLHSLQDGLVRTPCSAVLMGTVWQVLPRVPHLLGVSCILCPLTLAAFLPDPGDGLAAFSLHP